MNASTPLGQEWQILQQEQALHERNALCIKLVATGIAFVSLAVVVDLLLVGILIAMLWLQEAIVRTTQSRLENRLLQLELLYREDHARADAAFQHHTDWRAQRQGFLGLVAEYLRSAVRPTVAIPYAVLLLVLLAALSMPPG
ncbi:MAG: hypothetical protein V4695_06560 [Pseudomonadota bacterium]